MHTMTEECPYIEGMPKKSKLTLTPIASAQETLGQRLARVRKAHGLTQVELAQRCGLIQVLVSDYERGKLRIPAEMAVRFAEVMGITTDELLQPKRKGRTTKTAKPTKQPSLKLIRRMEQIEGLPTYQQRALLTTIDTFIAAAEAK